MAKLTGDKIIHNLFKLIINIYIFLTCS